LHCTAATRRRSAPYGTVPCRAVTDSVWKNL